MFGMDAFNRSPLQTFPFSSLQKHGKLIVTVLEIVHVSIFSRDDLPAWHAHSNRLFAGQGHVTKFDRVNHENRW